MVSCEIRVTQVQFFRLACPTACLSSWWKLFFSLYPAWTSCFNLRQFSLILPPCPPLQRAWHSHLENFFVGRGRLLLHPSEAASSPGWTNPSPSAFPHRASTPAPSHPGGLSPDLLQFVDVFLALGDQNWMQYFRCSLMSEEQRG